MEVFDNRLNFHPEQVDYWAVQAHQRELRNSLKAGLLRLQHTMAACAAMQVQVGLEVRERATRQTGMPSPSAPAGTDRTKVRPVDHGANGGNAVAIAAHADNGLTPREIAVVRMIAEGFSTKEIGARMGISFKTAVCHRANAMRKLDCHETATLVRCAIRMGLVQP